MKILYLASLFVLLTITGISHPRAGSPADLQAAYQQKQGTYPLRTRHLDPQGEPLYTNRLIHESSLYLLQHAHNPIDWWTWGDSALAAAAKADKPILLSIGYSSCHWCHVMERESFENLEIAEYINEHFIAIKVDREQHPDVDELYMTAVQRLSGSAGWPLTAVLTPTGQPFFGGTYFAPSQFRALLERISSTWQNQRSAVVEQAERVHAAIQASNQRTAKSFQLDQPTIQGALNNISTDLSAPAAPSAGSTFPREPEMLAVLEQALLKSDQTFDASLLTRLTAIANSGLHDQIGGGFHRYSVDPEWQVPHFEKMLYNQTQMAEVYLQAWLLTGEQRFREVGIATLDFIMSDLQDPKGGFYSAVDAQSEHREGAYYTWGIDQLVAELSESQLPIAADLFGLTPGGNFNGTHVLQYKPSAASPAQASTIMQTLKAARAQREAPITDTKIITAWNAMAIQALVTGHEFIGHNDWRDAAVRAAERLWAEVWQPAQQTLLRTPPNDAVATPGVLQDYAHLGLAMVALYDETANAQWLQRSELLATQLMAQFYDAEAGAFRAKSSNASTPLLINLINARDDALYSGNSAAAQLFAKLYHRTGNIDQRNQARSVLATFTDSIIRQPQSHSGLLRAASWLVNGEVGATLYAAKAKVITRAEVVNSELELTVEIAPGWHINANTVLEKELIPTQLNVAESSCTTLGQPTFPSSKKVTLGFQTTPLLVYENTVTISVPITPRVDTAGNGNSCQFIAAQLYLQACSHDVCLSPEVQNIRVSLP